MPIGGFFYLSLRILGAARQRPLRFWTYPMNPKRLLSTAAILCLILPAAAHADPPDDRGGGKDKGQHAEKAAPAGHAQQGDGKKEGPRQDVPRQGAAPAGNPGQGHAQQQPQPQRQAQPPRVQAMPGPAPAARPAERQPSNDRPKQNGGGPKGWTPAAPAMNQPPRTAPQRPAPAAQQPRPPMQAPQVQPRPPAASLGAWHAPARGPARDRATQQWRQQNQGWDQGSVWRRSPDWWRADRGFALFQGPRIGFFFIPNLGYRAVPSQYRNRHWEAGDYLPAWFRAYRVSDYQRYGLPRPPYGCVWVWLNGDVALIDRADGYILDVVGGVW